MIIIEDLCESCYNPDCIYSAVSGGLNEDEPTEQCGCYQNKEDKNNA